MVINIIVIMVVVMVIVSCHDDGYHERVMMVVSKVIAIMVTMVVFSVMVLMVTMVVCHDGPRALPQLKGSPM